MNMCRYPGRQQGDDFEEALCAEAASDSTSPERLRALAKKGRAIALEVARNPSTPLDLLEDLSREKDVLVRSAVVQNPSAPAALLGKMISGSPNFLQRAIAAHLHDEKALGLFNTSPTSSRVVIWLTSSTQKTLAQNIDTPSPVLDQIYRRWRRYIIGARKELLAVAKEDISLMAPYLARLTGKRDPWLMNEVAIAAANRETPPAFLALLASLGDRNLPYYLARNPNTPQRVLIELAKDPSFTLSVAANPSTPAYLLEEMSSTPALRAGIASNPNTPEELLEEFFESANDNVLWSLIQNPSTSPELLARLARHKQLQNPQALSTLLRNPKVPTEALLSLAQRPKLITTLRNLLVWHPNATPEVLQRVQLDERSALALANSPNAPPEMLAKLALDARLQGTAVISSLLQNSRLPMEVLLSFVNRRRLSMDERLAIAQNPKTPAEALAILAAMPGPRLRVFVARHPNTATDTLQFLAQSKVTAIRDAAQQRLTPQGEP
jgi:hypothetical protein